MTAASRTERSGPARLLVVDDSAFVRKTIQRLFEATPDVVVVGEAADGREALEKIAALSPDVVTLDLQMPGMNGVELLRRLVQTFPGMPVLVLASAAEKDGAVVFEALSVGAFDFVDKSRSNPMDLHLLGPEILRKVRAALDHRPGHVVPREAKRPSADSVVLPRDAAIVCIGASTGGPQAIQRVLEQLRGSFPLPVAIVQHMPAGFLSAFTERLNRLAALEVKEAEDGDPIRRGRVLVAPAGRHLGFSPGPDGLVAHLRRDRSKAPHVPSVDALFTSAAESFGAAVVAIVLSGMGSDGREGARRLAAKGAFIVAEARESCAVYGMPKAIVEAGIARAVWPLAEIARRLSDLG